MLPNKFQKKTFQNGLRLITVPMKQVKSVAVIISAAAGSRYETKEANGLSHFLEHMSFKGTRKRPSRAAVHGAIEGVGGEMNAGTSKDSIEFYVKLASSHLDLALDVLSDCLLNSQFVEEEIELEKGVIVEEINLYEDTPIAKVGDLFEELLYGDTPLGRDIAGKKETIKRFKRVDFLTYVKDFFIPNNLIVTVAGDFKKTQVLGLVSNYFAHLPKKDLPGWKRVSDQQGCPRVLLKSKKTDQAHFRLGVRAYPLGHKDRYIMAILDTVLGKMSSSRLSVEVREKRGLAYYVRSGKQAYQEVGYWVTQAGVDVKRLEETVAVVLEELKKIKAKKVTEKELERAREYLKGRLILSLEDSRTVADFYGEQELLEGKIKTPEQIITRLDRVTAGDIQRVAEEIFTPEKLNLAVIGPYKDENKFQKLLTSGT